MPRRLATLLASAALALLAALAIASPAAAVTLDQKLSVLSSWTQTSAASYNAWNAARHNQAAWAAYGFNWSTDYCSTSPDHPLGFDFQLLVPPARLRLPQLQGGRAVPANKSRIDDAFYLDLKREVRHVQRLRPAGLQQPRLDLLPGGQHLRLASPPSSRPTSTAPPG